MGIVSYAQNLEDVMLWRALGRVADGFYIDIGAQDSIQDSVGCAFYENGWTGIDVEPIAEYAEKLRQERPRNIVIEAVVTDNLVSERKIYCIPNTGLSTLNRKIARQHEADGFEIVVKKSKCITFDDLLALHHGEIHWAKIDVEGHEQQVIRSWNSSRRPWILVVEAVAPLTRLGTESEWEYLLFEKGYRRVWFDALNIFYLHEDHLDKADSFATPPNLFDGFHLSGKGSSCFHHFPASQAGVGTETFEARLEQALEQATERQADLQRSLNELEAERERILAEHSAWGQEAVRSAMARDAAFAAELAEVSARYAAREAQAKSDQSAIEARLDEAREHAARIQAEFQRRLDKLEADRARILNKQTARLAELAKSMHTREESFAAEMSALNSQHNAIELYIRKEYIALEAVLLKERGQRHNLELELMDCQGTLKAIEHDFVDAQSLIAELQKSIWQKFSEHLKRQLGR